MRGFAERVDVEEVQLFLDNVDAAKKLAERQKPRVDATDDDKPVPVPRSDSPAEDDDSLFDPIDAEVPDDCAWNVPECSLGGMRAVRSPECVFR